MPQSWDMGLPSLLKKGRGVISGGYSSWGMAFSTHPSLAQRFRLCRATPLFNPCVFKACCRERLPHRLLGYAVVGLSARRPKIHLKPVNMGSDVEKLALAAFLFHVIRFTRAGAIPLTYLTCPFASMSLRSRRIDTKPVHVRFLVNKLAPGHIFLLWLRFSPVSIIPLIFHSHISFTHHCCYVGLEIESIIK
jgi:hypothetical protein